MLTDNVKKSILQAIAGMTSSSTSLSAGYYMGLSLTEPSHDGSNFTEPSADAGYERVYINTQTHEGPQYPFEWVEGSHNSQVQNKFEVHFNVATANWGIISHVGIFSSNGTLLAYGHLVDAEGHETTIEVARGHIPTIVKGQAKISIDVE